MTLADLDVESRMRLVAFLCAFAWTDLEVKASERAFVLRILDRFMLDPSEREQAEVWLRLPPRPEQLDPTDIPVAQRQVFLSQAAQLMAIDGTVTPDERETLDLFERLLRAGTDEAPRG